MYTSNPLDTRLKAWDSINEFSPGDLLHTQFWPVFKEGLLHGLIDPDSTLQNNYITLIQKLYKEAPPVLTGEIYLCLLSHLINQVRTIYPFIDVSSAINDGTKINLKQQVICNSIATIYFLTTIRIVILSLLIVLLQLQILKANTNLSSLMKLILK